MLKIFMHLNKSTQTIFSAQVPDYRLGATRLNTMMAVFLGLLLLLHAGLVNAVNYYVSVSGNDLNPGTQAQPWGTIQHAADSVGPGDTVLVAGGIYREKIIFNTAGEKNNIITFKNLDGQVPVIEGQNSGVGKWDALVVFRDISYLHFEGFEVRNSDYWNLAIVGKSHHLEIAGCGIHDGQTGIWVEDESPVPTFTKLRGNDIYGHMAGGITIKASSAGYYLIDNNRVHHNLGEGNYDGIQAGTRDGATHHLIVRNNFIYENGQAEKGEDNLDMGGNGITHHKLAEGNHIYGGTGSFKLHSGSERHGYYTPGLSGHNIARFNVFENDYQSYAYPNPVAIYNNTFINTGRYIFFWNDFDDGLYNSFGDSTYTGGDTGRMTIKNNIFWQESSTSTNPLGHGGGAIDWNYDSMKLSSNLWKFASGQSIIWNGKYFSSTDSGFVAYKASNVPNYPDVGSIYTKEVVDRMFVNYAAKDFRLVSASPAVDTGAPLTKATNSGFNSTNLIVDRSSYFCDGYFKSGERLVEADTIVIDDNLPVSISSIDDATNTITLMSPRTWSKDDPVTLRFSGNAPDIGAYEFKSASSAPSAPKLNP